MAQQKIPIEAFRDYLKQLRLIFSRGNTTEVSLRTALEALVRRLNPDLNAVQEPARSGIFDAPDFRVYRKSIKVGYIETKELTTDLDAELENAQIKKYKESVDNIILTNYSRFILIRNGQPVFSFHLLETDDLTKSHSSISVEKAQQFMDMLDAFASCGITAIKSPDQLATELSKKARILKDLARTQLEHDMEHPNESSSSVSDFYNEMRELIKDISIDDCANEYAQTIIFGLFISKLNRAEKKIDRASAASSIPQNVRIIRKVFLNLADALPPSLAWIVDDIIEVFNSCDIEEILSDIGARAKSKETSFIMFYEKFLSQFDPKKRKTMGVYYTPRPVVSFIANSVNEVLKNEFNKIHGFAEDDVTVLDPAVGTGTFLRTIYILALIELETSGLSGMIEKKIETHLLNDFFGFEILITPYIISHMTLSSVIQKWFYNLKSKDRIQVYLTNTLSPLEFRTLIPSMKEITEESIAANEIKTRKRILTIVGNPPYSGVSFNKNEWIEDLLKKQYKLPNGNLRASYYEVDGAPLGERKVWLQDDYVKFIRFAQWKIDSAGEGVVGFISNHAYLDNPTFRGMRQSLTQTFERIYILNLHGNRLKNEKAPDGSDDENVFNIQQGVAIAIYVKNRKYMNRKVYYVDVYGTRDAKYSWLDSANWSSVSWTEIKPETPYYLFVPSDLKTSTEYYSAKAITEIFPKNVTGIVTAHDDFVTDFDVDPLKKRILLFTDKKLSDDYVQQSLQLSENYAWRVSQARKQLMDEKQLDDFFTKILYRPFDVREIFLHPSVVWRTRGELMRNMLKDNVGLITVREVAEGKFTHALVADKIVDNRLTASNKGTASIFPLYVYENNLRTPNISKELMDELELKYGRSIAPQDVLGYVYAILNSQKYRDKYAEDLKMDFPRIPFPQDEKTFNDVSGIGKTLIELHLERTKLTSHTRFDVAATNFVKFVKYKDRKVYVNETQFFEEVPNDMWAFQICGVQVLRKWLKSRRGRTLKPSEVEHFLQIVEIVRMTIQLMGQIDSAIPM